MNTIFDNREIVSAWCNGKAYHRPNQSVSLDFCRVIAIFDGTTYLARFRFKTKYEYQKSKRIVRNAIRKRLKG